MRVATKLATGYGLLVLLLAGVVVYHMAAVRGMQSTNETLSTLVLRLSRSAVDQLARLEELNENGSKYWVTGDAGYLSRFQLARDGFTDDLRELSGLGLSSAERIRLDSLTALWPRLLPPDATLDDLIAAHAEPVADTTGFDVWLGEAVGQLRERTRAIYAASEREMEQEVAASIQAAERVEALSLTSLVAALGVSVLVFALVFRSITGPLAHLRRGTQAVAGGNFEHRLEEERGDEFSELAADFNVMTERLRELDRAKRDFLSQISHDLKTPLAAMQDANMLLLEEIAGPLSEKQRRLLEHNLNSGRRLASMLGKLLDVSRIEAGVAEFRFRRCDLRDVVREAVSEFESAAERRGIALEAHLSESHLNVECDPERVLQVLENLIENAVRHSPEGGAIRVEARAYSSEPDGARGGGGFALVAVADAGPGVPDDEKAHIFERFHQSGSVRGRGGVGLGLAICKEIVRAHGGRIWVSDGPSGGSLFSFLLPLAGVRGPLTPVSGGAA
jgi:two-component system sensor histidine kinase GlrK